jgi:hypothetical protein
LLNDPEALLKKQQEVVEWWETKWAKTVKLLHSS